MLSCFIRRAMALTLLVGAGVVSAQKDNSIPIVVPAGPGSAPDIIGRVVGDELRARLGVPTFVDNRTGAGGIVAVMAAKASASPHALLLAQAAVVTVTPLTYRAAKYDLETDMEPVVVVADTPMLFVANPASGPKTLAEAVAMAKARPGALPMTSPARGSIPNLAAEILAQATGTSFNLVPMGGSAQAIQALVNGDSLVSVDGIAPLLPLVKSGRMRALAVTSPRVLPGLEGIPLAKETVPGLEATGWFVLFAKKGTPAARIKQINEAVNAALKSPEVVQKLAQTANYPVGGNVEEARAFVAREKKLWAAAVKRAGLQPE
jgi:tripartite-type tricarboxylate transporter receptor subunit TctC